LIAGLVDLSQDGEMRIALVDYGMGNLRSVEKALQRVGGDVHIATTPEELKGADKVLLPGVGAFGDCIRNLRKQNLFNELVRFIQSGKPFLGICLGYQALFESSEEEAGAEKGLSIFRGEVVRFPVNGLKVPQIGWNQIQIGRRECPILQGVADGSHVYFVHSYFPNPVDSSIVCAKTSYGESFASMVWRDNVFACQFHPEKSQKVGLTMLGNFVNL
jgi:imidazole glycerol-phosphate synthase subunit HisH